MFEPDLTEAIDPWLAARPGPIAAPTTMDTPASAPIATATPTVSEVGGSVAADAAAVAVGAVDAFGHLAEAPDPAAEAKKKLDGLDALTPADKATALGAMKPEEVAELVKNVPVEERARLVELAKASPNVDDKMAFFMAGQEAKVTADASADLDPDMDPDVAAKMKERREAIAASTLEEMQREQEHLKAKGAALTPHEVNEMIARKTREHDLEMTYNVNLTADEHVRTGGALAGKRVVWTEEELKVMESALSKSPAMQNGDNMHLETFHRSEDIGDHADHDPNTKTIRIADKSLKDEATHVIDPSGKPGMAIDIEKGFDPELTSDRRTFMEWVVLHEVGHNVHDFHEPEAYQKYKKGMLIHDDLSKEQLDARVPEEVSKDLDHGAKEIEHNGYVYVKVKDGYKCFPRAVFDDPPDSNGNWPNPDPREYFAQHYNQAILAPEATADEYLDQPAEHERQAREKLRIAEEERQKLADAGQDTSDIDRRIEHLEVRRQHATAKKRVWERSYHTMRNDVFHTNEAEHEARERLLDAGLDTAEFDERAARLSTPDQIAKLEEELLARDAAAP